LGDSKVLAILVGVPGGTGAGSEPDGRDDHRLARLVGKGDGIEPDVARELVRRFFEVGMEGSIYMVFLTSCL
jgi:hypothetical protein